MAARKELAVRFLEGNKKKDALESYLFESYPENHPYARGTKREVGL